MRSTGHGCNRSWMVRTPTVSRRRCWPSVVRICTHPRIYRKTSPLTETLAFCEALLEPAHSTLIQPGDRHWSIFTDLCESSDVSGNLVQDAWFAALAIEHGCQWISTDADYGRFRGLHWQRPFE